MKGWKTKAAAAGPILLGLGMIITGVVKFLDGDPDGAGMIKEGMVSFSGGMGLLGIGHKIEKAGQ
jgi:hypothetical protein